MNVVMLTKIRNKAWYIIYFTPTSNEESSSGVKTFFSACAPKAPNTIETNPKTNAVRMIFLPIIFLIKTSVFFRQKYNISLHLRHFFTIKK